MLIDIAVLAGVVLGTLASQLLTFAWRRLTPWKAPAPVIPHAPPLTGRRRDSDPAVDGRGEAPGRGRPHATSQRQISVGRPRPPRPDRYYAAHAYHGPDHGRFGYRRAVKMALRRNWIAHRGTAGNRHQRYTGARQVAAWQCPGYRWEQGPEKEEIMSEIPHPGQTLLTERGSTTRSGI
jgi:hypothetical protein